MVKILFQLKTIWLMSQKLYLKVHLEITNIFELQKSPTAPTSYATMARCTQCATASLY